MKQKEDVALIFDDNLKNHEFPQDSSEKKGNKQHYFEECIASCYQQYKNAMANKERFFYSPPLSNSKKNKNYTENQINTSSTADEAQRCQSNCGNFYS